MNEVNPEEINSPVLAIGQKNGMELFADVVAELSSTTKTNDKLDSLVNYFAVAPEKDRVWLIALFSGRRPKRVVNSTQLWNWCIEVAGIPAWLFAESYHTVGDLAETIALLLPDPSLQPGEARLTSEVSTVSAPLPLLPELAFIPHQSTLQQSLSYYLEKFIQIEKEDEAIRKQFILESWQEMNQNEKFVFNKLITGNFRIGVSQKMPPAYHRP